MRELYSVSREATLFVFLLWLAGATWLCVVSSRRTKNSRLAIAAAGFLLLFASTVIEIGLMENLSTLPNSADQNPRVISYVLNGLVVIGSCGGCTLSFFGVLTFLDQKFKKLR